MTSIPPGPTRIAFDQAARRLAELGRRFDARGWVLGTSGNLSVVVSREPLRLAITPSAAAKGQLAPEQILEVDDGGRPVGNPTGRPSAETQLHLTLARCRAAGAVLHTHSVWSTILSEWHAPNGGLAIDGYEMLKGLSGVVTHEHCEWIPIIENSQDMTGLGHAIEEAVTRFPECHGLLLRRHGLYTWGTDLAEASRHIEILEFLFEALGRLRDRRVE